MNRPSALIALCSLVVITAVAAPHAVGPKGPTDYPAKIVFQDRPGDAITSDGKGAYVNGVDGVTAVFQVETSGGQFLVKFAPVKGKMVRSVKYAYSDGVASACDGNPSDNPVGTVNDSGYFAFLNVATMPAGATLAKQGSFTTTTMGTFRFHDATKVDPINPYYCGDLLVITRLNATTWVVTTDTTPGQVYYNSAGTAMSTADPEEVGSRVQLDNVATKEFFGNYRMPFLATISCLSASVCPAAQ